MMKNNKLKISILGCGWLGLPLAETLMSEKFQVKGSTTTPSKISSLKDKGIDPFLIELQEEDINGPFKAFTEDSDLLIIDIPPGIRKDPQREYPSVIKNLLSHLTPSTTPHILYISSTSVFPNRNGVFLESDHFEPDTDAGRQLLEAEGLIMNYNKGHNTVLRLGGLIGPDRHPVHFLSGKQNLRGGSNKVNLIDRDDVIGIILAIIRQDQWGKTLHGVTPAHPTKEEYYSLTARKMQLPPPEYLPSNIPDPGKEISSDFTRELLNYSFKNPGLEPSM